MIRYLIMDVDGSLTDGKIYMGSNGEAMKAFSVKDGYVINSILKSNNIIPIILTARISSIVQNRCEELGIEEVYQGKKEKLDALKEIIGESNFGSCAYFGDDIIDLQCINSIKEAGGVVGCPADAVQKVRSAVNYICLAKAGEGALREFVEWLVEPQIDFIEIERRVNFAVGYLQDLAVSEKDIGKKVIVNDDFYYTVLEYATKSEKEINLESHRKYVDIQIIVRGEELMGIADISRLAIQKNYDNEQDVMLWQIPKRMAKIMLKAGDYIILYPEHAHCATIIDGNKSQKILKIVGKVRIV